MSSSFLLDEANYRDLIKVIIKCIQIILALDLELAARIYTKICRIFKNIIRKRVWHQILIINPQKTEYSNIYQHLADQIKFTICISLTYAKEPIYYGDYYFNKLAIS